MAPRLLILSLMLRLVTALTLGLVLASPAWAATKLESVRAQVTALRKSMGEVRGQQRSLRQELNQLASRIERLKSQRQGKLLGDRELDQGLRRSQEISTALTGLAQQLAGWETQLERENRLLLEAVAEELTRLRQAFDQQSDRAERGRLLAQIRALRAEREQVRAALPAGSVPALDSAEVSEDPEDLLEQADALRDRQEKVRRELGALEARIAERREERELDRRMNEFLGEASLFDEQDRRFRLQRDSLERSASGGGFKSAGAEPAGFAASENSAAPAPNQDPAAPPDLDPGESVTARSALASDARPIIGEAPAMNLSGDELEQLEAHKLKLGRMLEELRQRAQQLEARAKKLR